MRSSIDGGVTFSAARYVGHSKNSEIGRTVFYRGDLELAIGTGVTYLAYTSAHDTVAVRRTLNRGVSWTSAKVLNTSAGSEYSLVASGSKAVIGYTSSSSGPMKARFRRTTDKGTTWSASKPLVGASTGTFSARPEFSYRSGVLVVIFKYGHPAPRRSGPRKAPTSVCRGRHGRESAWPISRAATPNLRASPSSARCASPATTRTAAPRMRASGSVARSSGGAPARRRRGVRARFATAGRLDAYFRLSGSRVLDANGRKMVDAMVGHRVRPTLGVGAGHGEPRVAGICRPLASRMWGPRAAQNQASKPLM